MLRPAIMFSLCLDYQRGLFHNEAWCASRVQSETSVVESAELTLAIFESWTGARLQESVARAKRWKYSISFPVNS